MTAYIIAPVPLALRGVQYRPVSADKMLRRNLGIYGIGGLIAPARRTASAPTASTPSTN